MQSKNQNGSALVAVIGVVGVLLVLAIGFAFMYFSAASAANSLEQSLKAEADKSKVVLGQYQQKIAEAAQVTDMMRDDFVKVTTAAIEGRYGADGSKAVFQMLTESNPTLDKAVYTKLQSIIEDGRNRFETSQASMIERKRAYETALGSPIQGVFMGMAGYPKVDLASFKAVTTQSAKKAFETGVESGPIKLR